MSEWKAVLTISDNFDTELEVIQKAAAWGGGDMNDMLAECEYEYDGYLDADCHHISLLAVLFSQDYDRCLDASWRDFIEYGCVDDGKLEVGGYTKGNPREFFDVLVETSPRILDCDYKCTEDW